MDGERPRFSGRRPARGVDHVWPKEHSHVMFYKAEPSNPWTKRLDQAYWDQDLWDRTEHPLLLLELKVQVPATPEVIGSTGADRVYIHLMKPEARGELFDKTDGSLTTLRYIHERGAYLEGDESQAFLERHRLALEQSEVMGSVTLDHGPEPQQGVLSLDFTKHHFDRMLDAHSRAVSNLNGLRRMVQRAIGKLTRFSDTARHVPRVVRLARVIEYSPATSMRSAKEVAESLGDFDRHFAMTRSLLGSNLRITDKNINHTRLARRMYDGAGDDKRYGDLNYSVVVFEGMDLPPVKISTRAPLPLKEEPGTPLPARDLSVNEQGMPGYPLGIVEFDEGFYRLTERYQRLLKDSVGQVVRVSERREMSDGSTEELEVIGVVVRRDDEIILSLEDLN